MKFNTWLEYRLNRLYSVISLEKGFDEKLTDLAAQLLNFIHCLCSNRLVPVSFLMRIMYIMLNCITRLLNVLHYFVQRICQIVNFTSTAWSESAINQNN